MAKSRERTEARILRTKGHSLKEISNKLDISKSTASLWCRDVILNQKQIHRLEKRSLQKSLKGRLAGALMNKNKRLSVIERFKNDGLNEIATLNDRELTLIATALYWAEGSKTSSRFIFVNSNPDMVCLMFRFLINVLKVPREDIRIGIQINQIHTYRINKVLKFWSKLLDLPISQFDKPYYTKAIPKKVYENMDNYYGIVRLKVLRSSSLQYKILGLIDGVVVNAKNMSR